MALPMAGANWTDADAAGVAMLLHAAGDRVLVAIHRGAADAGSCCPAAGRTGVAHPGRQRRPRAPGPGRRRVALALRHLVGRSVAAVTLAQPPRGV